MSGQPFLDWPAITLSLFNAFLLFWLGFTILLESDHRSLGIWLAADGLFLGGAFFIAHSAILENGIHLTFPGINFWWQAGWWPVILSPFAWYSVILWYAGYWDDPASKMHSRQAPWFGLVMVFTAGLLGWMLISNPLPDIGIRGVPSTGFSVLALLFPVYIILCILLALDAILRPGPTARLLGDTARRRARPWLTASTLVLLVVSLLVALALFWGVSTLQSEYAENLISPDTYYSLTIFDLCIEILITIAILLIGQAAMIYEVFTSFPLPRSGLRKRWQLAVFTGGIISIIVAASWVFTLRAELAVLSILPVITGSLAIQNRIAAREQARETEQMRSLIGSEDTYEKIFLERESDDKDSNLKSGFESICNQILQSNKAVLVPTGVLSNFLPARISFPSDKESPANFLTNSASRKILKNLNPQALDPSEFDGFHWAVPLQSSRGLDGWLFIGERTNGEFYTLEEIRLAQAASERWMDTQTAAEIARRLVVLQRKQQIETRLLDQKARQTLHDEILPLLHIALLKDPKSPASSQITAAHQQISQLLRDAPPQPPAEIARDGLFSALRKTAEVEAAFIEAKLEFSFDHKVEESVKFLSIEAAETVFYAARECFRNINRHTMRNDGSPVEIKVIATLENFLQIIIENNSSSIEKNVEDQIISSGQGLALHSAMLAVFGGGLRLEHLDNLVTRVIISLPVSDDLTTD